MICKILKDKKEDIVRIELENEGKTIYHKVLPKEPMEEKEMRQMIKQIHKAMSKESEEKILKRAIELPLRQHQFIHKHPEFKLDKCCKDAIDQEIKKEEIEEEEQEKKFNEAKAEIEKRGYLSKEFMAKWGHGKTSKK